MHSEKKADCCAKASSGGLGTCCQKSLNEVVPKGAITLSETKPAPSDKVLPGGVDRVLAEIEVEHKALKSFGYFDAPAWQRQRLSAQQNVPVTEGFGKAVPEFDSAWTAVMRRFYIPGSTLTIAKNGKIIYSRGYGYADINSQAAMPPDALFRIASISKALTSVAVLKLCEQGKLTLDTKMMPLLKINTGEEHLDPELFQVNVRELLNCSGGWDRKLSGDPMFEEVARKAAAECSPTLRPTSDSIIQYWLRRRLDFIPNTHFAYSNFGYALLGKVIQKASGQPYEQYIRKEILEPLGLHSMRLGKTVELAPGEATYYPFPGQEENDSLYPNFRGKVPLPYGGDFVLEAMSADAGWLSNSEDLVRFASAVAGEGSKPVLAEKWRAQMFERPNLPEWKDKKLYFGMGWEVDTLEGDDKRRFSRQGSLPGAVAYVGHRADGYTYSFCCNSRPHDAIRLQREASLVVESALRAGKF